MTGLLTNMKELTKEKVSFNLAVEGQPETILSAAYIDVGEGPVVLLLHGFLRDATIWNSVIRHLSDRYRCISLDMLGFGESSRLDIEYRVESQIAFIKKFMETLEIENYFVMGHSLGGWIAASLELASSSSILGLILIAPGGIDERIEKYQGLKPLFWNSPVIDILLTIASPVAEFLYKKSIEDIRIIRRKFFDEPVFQKWMKRAFRLEVSDELLGERIQNISSPTYILAGNLDEVIPLWHCKYYEDNISGAKLQMIMDTDHSLPLNYSDIVSKLSDEFMRGICQ